MVPQPTEEDSSDEELEYADVASGRADSPRSPFTGSPHIHLLGSLLFSPHMIFLQRLLV
jgi:hypothetical protein